MFGASAGGIASTLAGGAMSKLFGFFLFSSRRRHTRWNCDWSSDVYSSDLTQRLQLTIKPTAETRDGETAGELDFIPDYGNVIVVISDVVSGSAAAEAGLQGGDRVLAIGGQPVKSSEQVVQYVRSHKNEPVVFNLDRGGRQIQVTANVRPGEEKLGFYLGQRLPMG